MEEEMEGRTENLKLARELLAEQWDKLVAKWGYTILPDDKFQAKLLSHAASNNMLTTGTYNAAEGDSKKNEIGVYMSHAYTILDVQEVT